MSSSTSDTKHPELQDIRKASVTRYLVRWYHNTFYNATILGLCNIAAPGIWGAMNSLGAGGAQKPYLVNTANALTFCLMVASCFFSFILTKYIGIKGALIFGTLGYAPYAAGLYTNNRFGTVWLVLVGAALCGISAGVLGYWLTYRLGGQILGGAINLGLNADRDQAGKVSYTVYLIFIALQATGPFVALLLNRPSKVERTDGVKVDLTILDKPIQELRLMAKTFLSKKFLLVILFIGQAVYAEAVFFTYLSLWFTVRARALGSFLSGIIAVTCGNILGLWLDRTSVPLKTRSRSAFCIIMTLQGAWWVWATVLVSRFRHTQPTYDWSSSGFGHAFAPYLLLTAGFQINYLFCYFIMGQLAKDPSEVIRYAALLKGTKSAWQAASYGLNSIHIFATVGGVYINFGLWAVGFAPAWAVIRHFGKDEIAALLLMALRWGNGHVLSMRKVQLQWMVVTKTRWWNRQTLARLRE